MLHLKTKNYKVGLKSKTKQGQSDEKICKSLRNIYLRLDLIDFELGRCLGTYGMILTKTKVLLSAIVPYISTPGVIYHPEHEH